MIGSARSRAALWVIAAGVAAYACGGEVGGDGGTGGGASTVSSSSHGGGSPASSSSMQSSASAGGHDAGPTITPAPFDLVMFVGTGQSLSVGAAGTPVVSSQQPFSNLKLFDAAPDPKYDGQGDMLSLVPLVSPIRPSMAGYPPIAYPNNIAGETPNEGMSNQVSALTQAIGGFDTVSVAANVGESGQSITVIEKGGTGNAYASTLYEAQAVKALAAQQQKTFGVGAVILTHGETDANDANYEAEIQKLQADYEADLSAITGQSSPIPILVSQQATFPADAGSFAQSTLAAWRLGVDFPGKFYCVGPKYQYEYSADHVHFIASQYRRLGEKYAEVYVHAMLMKEDWAPLQPVKASIAGAVITVDFHVPTPPLVWEESISPPHQTVLTQWAKGRGFEAGDSTGALTITDVAIAGSSVTVTLAQPPAGQNLTVAYALFQDQQGYSGGTDNGRRGQLRDSDPFVGYDQETVACNVTQGSNVVTAMAPGSLDARARTDLATGAFFASDAVVMAKNGDALTLSQPWNGATGQAMITFRNDQRNYAVQFAMPVN